MATYTGTSDANGDFNISFGSNSYTSGEKVTVTAVKDSATKSVELYAPSEVVGGGVIQFSGNLTNFPQNIGMVTLTGLMGKIADYAFAISSGTQATHIFRCATGLTIDSGVNEIGAYCFLYWQGITILNLPETLTKIGNYAFSNCPELLSINLPSALTQLGTYSFNVCAKVISLTMGNNVAIIPQECFWGLTALKSADLGSGLTTIGQYGCGGWSNCDTVIVRATTPPAIQANSFQGLKGTCIIKVPAGSVTAYQSATNWSVFASRIQAI